MKTSYSPAGYCPACGYPLDEGTCSECGKVIAVAAPLNPRRPAARARRMFLRLAMLTASIVALLFIANAAAYRWWPIASLDELRKGRGRLSTWARQVWEWRDGIEQERAATRLKQIVGEISRHPDHPWAGVYLDLADGRRTVCAMSESGFVYVRAAGCSFGSMPGGIFGSYGEVVRVTDDAICLRPTVAAYSVSADPPLELKYLRIGWGRRHCLLEEDTVGYTADNERLFLGIWANMLLHREHDLKIPIEGMPRVPAELRGRLPIGDYTPMPVLHANSDERPSEYEGHRVIRVRATVSIRDLKKPIDFTWVLGLFSDLPDGNIVNVNGDEAVIEYSRDCSEHESLVVAEPGWTFVYVAEDEEEANELAKAAAEGEGADVESDEPD